MSQRDKFRNREWINEVKGGAIRPFVIITQGITGGGRRSTTTYYKRGGGGMRGRKVIRIERTRRSKRKINEGAPRSVVERAPAATPGGDRGDRLREKKRASAGLESGAWYRCRGAICHGFGGRNSMQGLPPISSHEVSSFK